MSEWRGDIADYIDREVIEDAVVRGRFELPRTAEGRYTGFVDPSGGSSDSFALAIGHGASGARVILDTVREVRPPFSAEAVVMEFAKLLKSYGITRVVGDRYAGEWPWERFRLQGITSEVADKSKSDYYVEFLPLLNSRRLELLDNRKLVGQFAGLERRVGRGTGKDTIDHGPGGHDDLANVVAGCMVSVAAESTHVGPLITDEVIARMRAYRRGGSGSGWPVGGVVGPPFSISCSDVWGAGR